MEKINNKLRLSKQKLTSLPFRKIAPNIVTMLALCAGVTSIRYSIAENWAMAVICIFLAAFFDGLDGRVARMLKGSTKFGAELDSLSDFVSFGVAPAILMFQWTLFDLPKFGWFFCLLFAIGMSMRLARFNTMLDEDPQPEYWHHFFVGVPAPAAAALAIMPIMMTFDFPELEYILRSNTFCSVLMLVVAFLMVSRIPTVSTKKMKVPTFMFIPMMLVVALFASFIISQPWMTLGVMTALYALSIPVGIFVFLHEKREYENGYRLTKQILGDKYDAYIGNNDMTALGILACLKDHNIKTNVAGFDNIPETDFPQIQLTTVDHGACEKGKEAVDILLEQTKSERKRIVHMEYEPQLIIRLSTFNRKKSSSQ